MASALQIEQMWQDASEADLARRLYPRFEVQISAELVGPYGTQPTRLEDIAAGGAGIDGAIGIRPNDVVSLKLSDGVTVPGQIIWCLLGRCGIQFDEPLSDEALASILRAASTKASSGEASSAENAAPNND